jgi:cell division protein FtsQ
MIKPGKIIFLFLVFITFSTYLPNFKNESKSLIFPIKKIEIQNQQVIDFNKLSYELDYLLGKSLLFLNQKPIGFSLKKFDLIESFSIKKIYPKTIRIIVTEKKPIAILINSKKKFYISENGQLVKFLKLSDYDNLPLVFGKKANFVEVFDYLKKIYFPINEIKSFHYFNIGRWDITLKDNRVLKMPQKDYNKILENFITIKEDKNFDKYQIFDYRIKDQLILN